MTPPQMHVPDQLLLPPLQVRQPLLTKVHSHATDVHELRLITNRRRSRNKRCRVVPKLERSSDERATDAQGRLVLFDPYVETSP